jgi:hypothetical protein
MISEHISYKEAVRSNTAKRLDIDNTPDKEAMVRMVIIAAEVFEPLRLYVGGGIKVNSFFRCKELNTAIGGSKYSQHIKGQAIDIDDTLGHKTNKEMFYYIKDNLSFDQLIWEFGTDENPNWIHVSYVCNEHNRKQVKIAYKENGKTKYKNWKQ